MTPERWQQVKDIFDRAVECDPASRMAFIREHCGGDEELRREVESLLASEPETGSLLDNPLMETSTNASSGYNPAVFLPTQNDSFGPYVPFRLLGEGGMGTVYLAQQQQPIRREVALKVVKLGMDSRQVLQRFESERHALALIEYPNVARVLDAGTSERGRPYFVMEYVDGVPITQYCDRNALNTRDRLQLFIPVCNALQHAHRKGIIHRDVKPSNLLVTEVDGKPVPKVIDFGIARAIDQRSVEQEAFTAIGQIVGTPEYMSPEQAGMGGDIDTGTDVYSLGVVLYELLVGALPLDMKALRKIALGEVLRAIRETPVPKPTARITQMGAAAEALALQRGTDPGQLKRDLSGDLDWIVMKAIDKDRGCRYGSASEFAADIERYLKGEPVLAGPPGAAYRMRKFAVRHKRPVAAAAAVVVALIAGIFTTAWQARVAGQQKAVALIEKAEADGQRVVAQEQAAEAARQRDAAQAASVRASAAEGRAEQQRNAALAQQRRANNEAAIATAVVDFLRKDVLGQASAAEQAGPGTNPDPDLKVRTALDRAAARIAGKFDGEPLVEASIRFTMGNAFKDLGQYPEAQRELERALELRRRALGEEHPDTLASMNTLADYYNMQTRYAQAEALYSKVLDVRRRVLGPKHPDTLETMHGLGASYHYQRKYEQAEALMKETLDIRRRLLGLEHPDTAAIMADLATDYSNQGKIEQAAELHAQALEIRRRVLGPEHPNTLTNTANLADDYLIQGKYGQAESLHQQILEIRRRALGPEHPDTLRSMSLLALVYSREGRYAEGNALQMQTLEIRRRLLGPEHLVTQFTAMRLAGSYVEQGKYMQAEALYAQALDVRRRVLGREDPVTLDSMDSLGRTYSYLGRYAEAAALHAEALEIRRRKLGPEDYLTLATTNYLAMADWALGRYGEAEALQSELNAICGRVLGFDNSLTLIGMRTLALVYQSQMKSAQAEALLSKVLETMRHIAEVRQLSRATILNELARADLSQGKYEQAETLLRECLSIGDTKTPENWESLRCRSLLGASLAGQKRYAEAEPLLMEGYDGMLQRESVIPALFRFNVAHAVEQLAQLYRALGKTDRAAEWDLVAQARKAAVSK